jgi:hypothetical protein
LSSSIALLAAAATAGLESIDNLCHMNSILDLRNNTLQFLFHAHTGAIVSVLELLGSYFTADDNHTIGVILYITFKEYKYICEEELYL